MHTRYIFACFRLSSIQTNPKATILSLEIFWRIVMTKHSDAISQSDKKQSEMTGILKLLSMQEELETCHLKKGCNFVCCIQIG